MLHFWRQFLPCKVFVMAAVCLQPIAGLAIKVIANFVAQTCCLSQRDELLPVPGQTDKKPGRQPAATLYFLEAA